MDPHRQHHQSQPTHAIPPHLLLTPHARTLLDAPLHTTASSRLRDLRWDIPLRPRCQTLASFPPRHLPQRRNLLAIRRWAGHHSRSLRPPAPPSLHPPLAPPGKAENHASLALHTRLCRLSRCRSPARKRIRHRAPRRVRAIRRLGRDLECRGSEHGDHLRVLAGAEATGEEVVAGMVCGEECSTATCHAHP